jgi:hypothetical protein
MPPERPVPKRLHYPGVFVAAPHPQSNRPEPANMEKA